MPLRALRLQLRYARTRLEGRRAEGVTRFVEAVRSAVADMAQAERGVVDVVGDELKGLRVRGVTAALSDEFGERRAKHDAAVADVCEAIEVARRRGAVADAVGEGLQGDEEESQGQREPAAGPEL